MGTPPVVRHKRESGFTLVDMLVGIAIGSLVLALLLMIATHVSTVAASTDARAQAQSTVNRVGERLASDAASAQAVFVPAADVNGTPNADGHELDFYAEDSSHRTYAWAYTYDAASKTLTRYVYAPGVAPVGGEQFTSLDAFDATTIPASQIASADPLFAGATVTDVAYNVPAISSARAGNALVDVHLVAHDIDTRTLLATTSAPTSFTVLVTYTPSPAPASTATPTPIPLSGATP